MWIEKRTNKDGKVTYRYWERYTDTKTNTIKRVSVTHKNKTRETQKIALQQLADKIEEKLNLQEIKKPNLTFYQLLEEWLPIYKQQVKESTYYPTKNIFNTVKKKIKSDVVLTGITTIDLNDIFEDMIYKDNLSNKYVSIIKAKLNLVFSYAYKKGYILENPMNAVVITFKRENKTTRIKDKFLENDEYQRLLAYTNQLNKRYALLFEWLYLTGMRPGEALALHKDDISIDEESATVTISGTMLYRERKITDMKKSDSTKTAAGMREIDLSSRAVEIYHELLELNPDHTFLFQTKNGTPIQLTAINTFLRDHKEEMKINKQLSSHIFRHTHISKLAEIGVPLYAIQDRVGHENSKITETIYLHVTKSVKDELKNNLEKL